MSRTSRSVAQRLASQQQKPKKRRTPRPGAVNPAPSPSIDQILDEVVPSESGTRAAMTPTLSPAKPASDASPATSRPASTRPAGRRAASAASARLAKTIAPRRRFHEYAAEYQYIWADLQRIVVVAGVLIVLLVVLSFFIQ